MATFGEIRINISSNLDDAGVVFYDNDDITESMQDAYDDIAFQTQCIIKEDTTVPYPINANYINLKEQIEDFLCVLAIFNPNINRWMFDHVTLRHMDAFRLDWELWQNTPQFWMPMSFDMIVVAPQYSATPVAGTVPPLYINTLQNMQIFYAATAPIIQDTDSPLIAMDFQNLIEIYSTADLLEQNEEFIKAQDYWEQYVNGVEEYRDRVHRLAKRDLLMRK